MVDMTREQKKYTLQVFAGIVAVIAFIIAVWEQSMTGSEAAAYFGIFFGVAVKLIAPFVQKIFEGEADWFDLDKLWASFVTFFYTIPLMTALVTSIDLTTLPWPLTLAFGFFIGAGGNWTTEGAAKLWEIARRGYESRGHDSANLAAEENLSVEGTDLSTEEDPLVVKSDEEPEEVEQEEKMEEEEPESPPDVEEFEEPDFGYGDYKTDKDEDKFSM